eukprot:GABV01010865.1.p1 GENE.GABV01010865.1~~GABV01010865.1.p1  ORF type:complete len:131 (-),score=19.36 GABV01010865.1:40-432(-)
MDSGKRTDTGKRLEITFPSENDSGSTNSTHNSSHGRDAIHRHGLTTQIRRFFSVSRNGNKISTECAPNKCLRDELNNGDRIQCEFKNARSRRFVCGPSKEHTVRIGGANAQTRSWRHTKRLTGAHGALKQ